MRGTDHEAQTLLGAIQSAAEETCASSGIPTGMVESLFRKTVFDWAGFNVYCGSQARCSDLPQPFAELAMEASKWIPGFMAEALARRVWKRFEGNFLDLPKTARRDIMLAEILQHRGGTAELDVQLCRKWNISRRQVCKLRRKALEARRNPVPPRSDPPPDPATLGNALVRRPA